MKTLEIRAADGGLDAEDFAKELESAVKRSLVREEIAFTQTNNGITFHKVTPSWL